MGDDWDTNECDLFIKENYDIVLQVVKDRKLTDGKWDLTDRNTIVHITHCATNILYNANDLARNYIFNKMNWYAEQLFNWRLFFNCDCMSCKWMRQLTGPVDWWLVCTARRTITQLFRIGRYGDKCRNCLCNFKKGCEHHEYTDDYNKRWYPRQITDNKTVPTENNLESIQL